METRVIGTGGISAAGDPHRGFWRKVDLKHLVREAVTTLQVMKSRHVMQTSPVVQVLSAHAS